MKIRKLIALVLIATMAAGSIMSVVANADDQHADGEGKVEFKVPENIVISPYDPENPEEELPEDDGHEVLEPGGPLHLQVIPRFNFGIHDLSADVGGTYDHIVPHYAHIVMVWDHRHITETGNGTPEGWSVYAQMTSEFEHATLDLELTGAQITFSDARSSGTGGQLGSVAPSILGGAGALEYDDVAGSRLFIGSADEGEGGWNTHIAFGGNEEDIQLVIPTGTSAVSGVYTAVVQWTLTSAPKNAGN